MVEPQFWAVMGCNSSLYEPGGNFPAIETDFLQAVFLCIFGLS